MSDLPSWARVGAKVVCVDADPRGGDRPRRLTAGGVYTIRQVVVGAIDADGAPYVGVHLEEIQRTPYRDIGVVPFDIARFRPLVSESDDVALFTHHLDSVRNTEHA